MVEADPETEIDAVHAGVDANRRLRYRAHRTIAPEAELGRPASDDELDGVTRGAVALGRTISGADYLEAVGTVHDIGRRMARFLGDDRGFDMLLTSTLAEPPAVDRTVQARQRRLPRLPLGRRWGAAVLAVHRSGQRHRSTGDDGAAVLERRRPADRHPFHGAAPATRRCCCSWRLSSNKPTPGSTAPRRCGRLVSAHPTCGTCTSRGAAGTPTGDNTANAELQRPSRPWPGHAAQRRQGRRRLLSWRQLTEELGRGLGDRQHGSFERGLGRR